MERHALVNIVEQAWKQGIAIQSNYFRANPKLVTAAASLGYITTIDSEGNFGGLWRPTPEGCTYLFKHIEGDTNYARTESKEYSHNTRIISDGILRPTAEVPTISRDSGDCY